MMCLLTPFKRFERWSKHKWPDCCWTKVLTVMADFVMKKWPKFRTDYLNCDLYKVFFFILQHTAAYIKECLLTKNMQLDILSSTIGLLPLVQLTFIPRSNDVIQIIIVDPLPEQKKPEFTIFAPPTTFSNIAGWYHIFNLCFLHAPKITSCWTSPAMLNSLPA